ncbi:MAG: hypothetical protein KKD77_24530 [Gammaproteobacteria bacterium]|nr:hypothetical protein [Gammaproteobacteria bacterium]
MDFYQNQEAKKRKALAEIASLVDEAYQLNKQRESIQKRLAEIDEAVAVRESAIMTIEQVQRDFNSYLAVKENAVTLDDIKKGVEAAGPPPPALEKDMGG